MVKIGMLTFHRANNYGAILQAYSLYTRLTQLGDGFEVKLININYRNRETSDFFKYNMRRFIPKIKNLRNYRVMKRFVKDYTQMTKFKLIRTEEEGINYVNDQDFDVLITGSDEVWKKKNEYLSIPNIYWLSPRMKGHKLSFAATANRTRYDVYTDYEKVIMQSYLDVYDLITIRDNHTKGLIEPIVKKPLHFMCDPTFLIDFEDLDISRQVFASGLDTSKPVIGFMGGYDLLVDRIKDRYGPAYEYISFYQHIKGTKFIGDLNPLEFVGVFKYCDLVVTSFFHGTVFSIINEVPFISVEMKDYKGMESKISHLLSDTELTERYFVRDATMNFDRLIMVADQLLEDDSFDYSSFKLRQRAKFDVFEDKLRSYL